jgi:serine/threonine protein kinase
LHYQAPEIRGLVSGSEDTSEYTSAVDLWSLGCVVYQSISQKVPFQNLNALFLYVKGEVAFPTTELVSRSIGQHGIGLIGGLLMLDPRKRVTAEAALRSPWLDTTSESSISTPLGQHVPLELAASSNQQGLVYLARQREEDEAQQRLEDETRQREEDEARQREEDEAR